VTAKNKREEKRKTQREKINERGEGQKDLLLEDIEIGKVEIIKIIENQKKLIYGTSPPLEARL